MSLPNKRLNEIKDQILTETSADKLYMVKKELYQFWQDRKDECEKFKNNFKNVDKYLLHFTQSSNDVDETLSGVSLLIGDLYGKSVKYCRVWEKEYLDLVDIIDKKVDLINENIDLKSKIDIINKNVDLKSKKVDKPIDNKQKVKRDEKIPIKKSIFDNLKEKIKL